MISNRLLRGFGGFFLTGALVLVASAAPAQQDFRRGDANADGVVDIADASFIFRYLYPCEDAANANDDGRVDSSDPIMILCYLFVQGVPELPLPGATTPGPDPTADNLSCESYAPLSEGKKADFTLKFLCPDIPSAAPGETVRWTAYAALRTDNNVAGHGAQAWSLSIAAEGARIVSATTDGTIVPEVLTSKAPFQKSEVVDPQADAGSGPQGEGVVSAVLLSDDLSGTTLPAEGISTLLAITLEAVVPQGGLGPVTLSFVDGKKGSGRPVRNVISLDGIAYTPSFGGCQPLFPDCNRNDVDDAEDIASGASTDCDANGIPDECDLAKGAPDCSRNGILDSCDIASGGSSDCDANGVPDECQEDCNSNGIPDACDIASGTSKDANGDGLADECQGCGAPDACQSGESPAFELGFLGPCLVTGEPGAEREVTVLAMLSSNCALPLEKGAQWWGIGIATYGCEVVAATDDGTVSATVDRGGLRECVASTGCFSAKAADPARSGGRSGIISGALLAGQGPVTLDPAKSPQAILRLTVRVRVPEDGSCAAATLRYEDGLARTGGDPVTNHVVAQAVTLSPKLGELRISFASSGGSDCDANGVPDVCQGDCNRNGVPDPCDIASGASRDADGDGVPDECQAGCVRTAPPPGADGPIFEACIVKDIVSGTESSGPQYPTALGDRVFFVADDGQSGRELWVSDETRDGTMLFKDLYPGSEGSSPGGLTALGNRLFFAADDGQTGYELWVSDGTPEGTTLLKDLNPGPEGSYPDSLTVLGDRLFFAANDGESGNELWVSDGTPEGTTLLKDVNPGPEGSDPCFLAAAAGRLFFAANDGQTGHELWVSDGTPGETWLFKDLNPGAEGSYPGAVTALGNRLFFDADDGKSGYELWVSDGTPEQTTLFKDLKPGSEGSEPVELTAVRDRLFFAANDGQSGQELWVLSALAEETLFLRGDSNADGVTDISDAIASLGFLFLGSRRPSCIKSADTNDDGKVDITDPIYLLTFKFLGGRAPPEPFPACGTDAARPDDLPCVSFAGCP